MDKEIQKFNEENFFAFDNPQPPKRGLAILMSWAGTGHKILDIACGVGFYAAKMRDLGNEVEGLDIAPSSIKMMKKKGMNAVIGSAEEKWPFSASSYDRVVMTDILEHLFFPHRALAEARRVLKPGGQVMISVPNAASWLVRTRMLFGQLHFTGQDPRLPPWKEPHIRFYTVRTMKQMLQETGFNVLEVRGTVVVFPGALADYLPKPFGPPLRGINKLARGSNFLRDLNPSLFSTYLMILAEKEK